MPEAAAPQTEAYVDPDESDEICVCRECREARWWRDQPGENPESFDHASNIARASASAHRFDRWLKRNFLPTFKGSPRFGREDRQAATMSRILTAWAEVAELEQVDFVSVLVSIEKVEVIEQKFADYRASNAGDLPHVFDMNQRRMWELSGAAWMNIRNPGDDAVDLDRCVAEWDYYVGAYEDAIAASQLT